MQTAGLLAQGLLSTPSRTDLIGTVAKIEAS